MELKKINLCINCVHSYERSDFDRRRNGWEECRYECLEKDRKYPVYVFAWDSCDKWEKK